MQQKYFIYYYYNLQGLFYNIESTKTAVAGEKVFNELCECKLSVVHRILRKEKQMLLVILH